MKPNSSFNRGVLSETMVERALIAIQDHRIHTSLPEIIGFEHAPRNSHLDRAHIDFLVRVRNGDGDPLQVPLQVKSSERRRRKFLRFCRHKGLFIATVVVKAGEKLKSVAEKVAAEIRNAILAIRKKIDRRIQLARIRADKRNRKRDLYFRHHAPLMCH